MHSRELHEKQKTFDFVVIFVSSPNESLRLSPAPWLPQRGSRRLDPNLIKV